MNKGYYKDRKTGEVKPGDFEDAWRSFIDDFEDEEDDNTLQEISSSNKAKLDKYFNELVPGSGKSDTVNGEIIRAVSRIAYRWYNDGDKFYEGYGAETAGPAMAFLTNSPNIDPQIRISFAQAETKAQGGPDSIYEAFLDKIIELAINHVELIPDKPNNEDMFDYDSEYKDWEDDEWEDDEWDDEY
jgi:hypothetical protein